MTHIQTVSRSEVATARGQQENRGRVMMALTNGLELPQKLSFDKWLVIGKQLSAAHTSSAWCLGDWLAFGIEAFADRYRNALEQTSLDYQTLRNYVWVARRFTISRRWEALSFAHHAEVAALDRPEQDFWLRKAAELKWSVKQLRREVRASLQERKVDGDTADESHQEPELMKLSIRIDPDQFQSCQAAAMKVGLDVEEWVVMTLVQATQSA